MAYYFNVDTQQCIAPIAQKQCVIDVRLATIFNGQFLMKKWIHEKFSLQKKMEANIRISRSAGMWPSCVKCVKFGHIMVDTYFKQPRHLTYYTWNLLSYVALMQCTNQVFKTEMQKNSVVKHGRSMMKTVQCVSLFLGDSRVLSKHGGTWDCPISDNMA